MGKKKQLIIPVFIPFGGCPHKCVFCDQRGITGQSGMPSSEDVSLKIREYLSTWKGIGRREVAFYGGSFTGLTTTEQEEYLGAAKVFVDAGDIDGLRISTRPDYIDAEVVERLLRFKVEVVELGVQSLDNEVLALSGRGHDVESVEAAVGFLKEACIEVGIQLMPGLPGDTVERVIETARATVALAPAFVRIYPTLVIKDTALAELYDAGRYEAWNLTDMVELLKKVNRIFEQAGIKIIRMGLHSSKELEQSLIDGPYHPDLRGLVAKAG
ncbi:Oxygen-independent coproporphyrinogen III oxidase [hydrothermal vent metagenome]|uniref:Oxygen-independent coproporphyrinogen III oxidase n=1 Tax=hydrothermal vent metagenome TaxID=652676 RepID=A0A3B0R231_9ZZZZ